MKKILFFLLMSTLTLMACPQGKACDAEAKGQQSAMQKPFCDKTGEAKACPTKENIGCSAKEDCTCPKCAEMKCSGKADCACAKCVQKSKAACPHCKI